MTGTRASLWLGVACGAALAFGGARRAGAQAGAPGSKPPPVRATSTVEVIDTGRGIDDIISRVRAQQQRPPAAGRAAPGQKGPGGTQDKGPGGTTTKREATPGGPTDTTAGRGRETDELRAERPERPRTHPERERRDLHRQEREAARRGQLERARDAKRP